MRYDQTFAKATMPYLVLCNMMREKPLTFRELTAYAGHKQGSLRVAKNTLKSEGAIDGAGNIVPSHPLVLKLAPIPLPDIRTLPRAWSKQNAALGKQAAALAEAVLTPSEIPSAQRRGRPLTINDYRALLDAHLSTGAAGRDPVPAIKAAVEMAGLLERPGPPAPLTSEERIERVAALLAFLSPSERLLALERSQLPQEPLPVAAATETLPAPETPLAAIPGALSAPEATPLQPEVG